MEMDMQITIAGGCGDFGRSCWQLAGDRYAGKAFLGKDAEILTNKGWNHTARKNL